MKGPIVDFRHSVQQAMKLPLLWDETLGCDEVCVAVLDGPVDLTHSCFDGAKVHQEHLAPTQVSSVAARIHGTHVASVIFGQHGGSVPGSAPDCRGLVLPIFQDGPDGSIAPCSQLDLARALQVAREYGATVINVSGGEYSSSGTAHPILAQEVRRCVESGIVIVAAVGNQGCECLQVPGALPAVLAVGATDELGEPLPFSNWGVPYRHQGVLAIGQNVLGAVPGNKTMRKTGTSFATPLVSGIVALLLCLQRKRGHKLDGSLARNAIIETAIGCDRSHDANCERLLAGRLNLSGAIRYLMNAAPMMQISEQPASDQQPIPSSDPISTSVMAAGDSIVKATNAGYDSSSGNSEGCDSSNDTKQPTSNPTADEIAAPTRETNMLNARDKSTVEPRLVPAACGCGNGGPAQLVFALGRIGYDFGTEARRDTIIARMDPVEFEIAATREEKEEPEKQRLPGNPFDPRQLLAFLESPENRSQAERITWTLRHDATTIYAIRPDGAYSGDAYKILVQFLREQLAEGVEVVSIAGTISGSVRLSTGETVPVIRPEIPGMFSWTVAKLVDDVLGAVLSNSANEEAKVRIQGELTNFLRRIYFEFRNLGRSSEDRAINFAGTQVFRLAQQLQHSLLAGQQRRGNQLHTVEVTRSAICRPDSDCWDVNIIFFDPENTLRARTKFVITVDVSDAIPVMLSDGVREFSTL